jgi:hypothetical protein
VEDVSLFYGHLVYFTAIWYILWQFGTLYGYSVHYMVIWYIIWLFGTLYGYLVHYLPALVCCTMENLATRLLTYVVVVLIQVTEQHLSHKTDILVARSRGFC